MAPWPGLALRGPRSETGGANANSCEPEGSSGLWFDRRESQVVHALLEGRADFSGGFFSLFHCSFGLIWGDQGELKCGGP